MDAGMCMQVRLWSYLMRTHQRMMQGTPTVAHYSVAPAQ